MWPFKKYTFAKQGSVRRGKKCSKFPPHKHIALSVYGYKIDKEQRLALRLRRFTTGEELVRYDDHVPWLNK